MQKGQNQKFKLPRGFIIVKRLNGYFNYIVLLSIELKLNINFKKKQY